MLLWGTLPLALKGVLAQLDPGTITWVRFVASAAALGAFFAWRGGLPAPSRLSRLEWILLAVATGFLAANYLGYVVALDLSTAVDAQVLIQIAPLLLSLGGIVIFRERFTRLQWLGFAVLVAGLALFFSAQLGALASGAERYGRAVLLFVLAAIVWAVYGLAQKQLLQTLPSGAIMFGIYLGCAVVFAPLAQPSALLGLNGVGIALLAYCAANTIAGYGAFAESLEHWEASRVSAVLALTPLATLAFSAIANIWWPGLERASPLPAASLLGAGLVVAGSIATALGGSQGSDGPGHRLEHD